MDTPESEAKRRNRTITLYLGNTLEEYNRLLENEGMDAVIRKVEIADSLDWGCLANGHAAGCPRHLHFTHHGGYTRGLKHFDGEKSPVEILRVRCLDCDEVFTIQPSFIVRYKRYGTDAIEKFMDLLFITEDSYRMAGVSQLLGMDSQRAGTWAALEKGSQAIQPRALWALVQWFGQLSPAQLNLALGVQPPQYILEDEKHAKECGQKVYIPMVYAPKEALIWWVDYLYSASETELQKSLERFKQASERLSHIVGATVDGWEGAQNALRSAFPGIALEECHFHAMLKLGKHLATYKRQREKAGHPVSAQEEEEIRTAFMRVLKATTPEAYQEALDELPDAFEHPTLVSRKRSLKEKQTLFQAWITDNKLAVVSTALDQCMKFLKRKLKNMQTFHGEESGLATVNAWAITRNCWRFLKGAIRAGLSPLELAGADFMGIPWMQLVNLVLSAWPTLGFSAAILCPST